MKLGYLCKYVPVELLESMGFQMVRLMPDTTGFEKADMLMDPNMCSFIKASLEEYAKNEYDGMILTNCCDSTRRLYDCISKEFPDRFHYMLDVPRLLTEAAEALYESSVRKLADKLETETGKQLDEDMLRMALAQSDDEEPEEEQEAAVNIAVIGARLGSSVREILQEYDVRVVDDMTCTEIQRKWSVPEERKDLLRSYVHELLNQFPCMRMAEIGQRNQRLQDDKERIDGILYHTMKFCDMYSYEFAYLSRTEEIPLLKIETDSTPQAEGQIRTRLEAFFESVAQSKGLPAESIRKQELQYVTSENKGRQDMFWRRKKTEKRKSGQRRDNSGNAICVVGIDSGSTSTNAVLMDENKIILASVVIRTGSKSIQSAEEAYRQVIQSAGLHPEEVSMVVSTGYGRVSIGFADREITEISCHGRGAHYFNPEVRTILDIGGQDSKAIRIDDEGAVLDFAMNDKCAAGTGRFLEMMASTLSVSLDELGPMSLDWHEDIDISSMCSVFAESEVISLIADNKEKPDIAHGVHKSIAARAVSLMKRVGLEEGFMMTGGVAKNHGAVKEIEKKIGKSMYICEEPEIVGAVGAALFGLDELMSPRQ